MDLMIRPEGALYTGWISVVANRSVYGGDG
jgi:hypothetical protein